MGLRERGEKLERKMWGPNQRRVVCPARASKNIGPVLEKLRKNKKAGRVNAQLNSQTRRSQEGRKNLGRGKGTKESGKSALGRL